MNAADWRKLNKIGLGICILLVLFSTIGLMWGSLLVGVRVPMELSVAGFVIGFFYLLFVLFSYQKLEEAEKLEKESDLKHQQERSKK